MAIKLMVFAFPIVIFVVAAGLNGTGFGGSASICVNAQTGCQSGGGTGPLSVFTCTSGFNPCFPGGNAPASIPTNAIIKCTTSDRNGALLNTDPPSCLLLNQCNGTVGGSGGVPVPQLFCRYTDIWRDSSLFLQTGTQITTGQTSSNGAPSIIGEGRGFVVTTDYTAILLGLVALASVAAVSIFAIGLNGEAVHIIFIVGGLLALWTILTVASGATLNGWTAGSMWQQLDSLQINGSSAFFGTALFLAASLMWYIGTLGAVSRGGV
jgi:hypothetical protein